MLLAGFVVIWVTRPTPAPALPPIPLAESRHLLADATVRINQVGCGLVHASGTAVALPDGRLLTAGHAVAGALGINVVPPSGPLLGGASAVHPKYDVGVITTRPPASQGIPLANRDPGPGERVLFGGYPMGAPELKMITARVIDEVDGRFLANPGPVLRLDRRAIKGMSGGPVLDASGHLAGILYAIEPGHSLVVPASTLKQVLDEGNLDPGRHC